MKSKQPSPTDTHRKQTNSSKVYEMEVSIANELGFLKGSGIQQSNLGNQLAHGNRKAFDKVRSNIDRYGRRTSQIKGPIEGARSGMLKGNATDHGRTLDHARSGSWKAQSLRDNPIRNTNQRSNVIQEVIDAQERSGEEKRASKPIASLRKSERMMQKKSSSASGHDPEDQEPESQEERDLAKIEDEDKPQKKTHLDNQRRNQHHIATEQSAPDNKVSRMLTSNSGHTFGPAFRKPRAVVDPEPARTPTITSKTTSIQRAPGGQQKISQANMESAVDQVD